jgi:hypothetical protein
MVGSLIHDMQIGPEMQPSLHEPMHAHVYVLPKRPIAHHCDGKDCNEREDGDDEGFLMFFGHRSVLIKFFQVPL